jgi:thiol:disulfide interchange protein DsbC
MNAFLSTKRLAAVLLILAATGAALAQEAVIRKNLAERLPGLPKIDEVTQTPVPGVYELRLGTEVIYTDAVGNHIIQGEIIDTRSRSNLTQARVERLTAIDFAALPMQDAIVIKQGSGSRKMAVFVDPNCGYCKRFERDLTTIKDVTIYAFLYPILGPDSKVKSRDIWCAKDSAASWRSWMLDGVKPATTMGECDSTALDRNVALGQKHRVQGTPALVFENGVRKPGAMSAEQVEKLLVEAAKRS